MYVKSHRKTKSAWDMRFVKLGVVGYHSPYKGSSFSDRFWSSPSVSIIVKLIFVGNTADSYFISKRILLNCLRNYKYAQLASMENLSKELMKMIFEAWACALKSTAVTSVSKWHNGYYCPTYM